MPTRYLDTAATGANNGTSWADAWNSWSTASAGVSAGDDLYVSHTASQVYSTGTTLSFPSSVGNPVRILSVNKSTGELASGAIVGVSGTNVLSMRGSIYAHGIRLTGASGTANTSISIANGTSTDVQTWENCSYFNESTGASARLTVGSSGNTTPCDVVFRNMSFYCPRNGTTVINASLRIIGGQLEAGSLSHASASHLFEFNSSGEGQLFIAEGFDFSAMPASLNLIDGEIRQAGRILFRDCRTPASWTGALMNTRSIGAVVEMVNCAGSAVNYRSRRALYMGDTREETGIYRDGGASDESVPASMKMTTTSSSGEYTMALTSELFGERWVETGSPKTATVEILTDRGTPLKDDEVWVELAYPGSATSPLATVVRNKRATPLTTPASHATSTATWTGTGGFGTVQKQKLVVTFTPQMKGNLYARVYLAAPSTTIYVDPVVQVT